jgi:hypothetical protein
MQMVPTPGTVGSLWTPAKVISASGSRHATMATTARSHAARCLVVCLAAAFLGCATAFVQPARLACAPTAASRAPGASMLAPVDPLPLLDAAATSAAASMPATMLLGDAFDALSGFLGSPAILLIPIGAGSLVASLIIWVLVKAAG